MPEPMIEWTPEVIGKVRRLWVDGHSATEVARLVGNGLTRSAVLGRIYRMGLSRNGKKPVHVAAKPVHAPKPERHMQRLPAMNSIWSLPENERRCEMARRAARAALITRLEMEAAN